MSQKNTILIVDDEPDIVNLTEKFLRLGEFDTITSNNAKEAMKMVEEHHDKIALILLDIMMPGRSGIDVLREIKSDERFKDIPVELFPVKPFSGKGLVNRIKRILSGEEVERGFSSNWASGPPWGDQISGRDF